MSFVMDDYIHSACVSHYIYNPVTQEVMIYHLKLKLKNHMNGNILQLDFYALECVWGANNSETHISENVFVPFSMKLVLIWQLHRVIIYLTKTRPKWRSHV